LRLATRTVRFGVPFSARACFGGVLVPLFAAAATWRDWRTAWVTRMRPLDPRVTRATGVGFGGGAGFASPSAPSAVSQAVLPTLMLIILGALAVLFFCDLKVPEPGGRR